MSATTEKILEEIKEVEQTLQLLELEGSTIGIIHMNEVLVELKKKLAKANEVLNEGKSILKGWSNMQKVDLYQPLESVRVGPAPVVLRTFVTTNNAMVVGGVPSSSKKIEDYVLLSSLPKELQERVKTAVQAILSGM